MYALFAWECYEQSGGFEDFRMSGSLEECTAAVDVFTNAGMDGHIVDLAQLKIVREFSVSLTQEMPALVGDPWIVKRVVKWRSGQ